MPEQPAVDLSALSRSYKTTKGEVLALDSVDLTVPQGQILAVLGENGAGKTTLTKILATLLYPSSGTARVFGHDVMKDARTVRSLVTAVFGGDRGLYPMLSGRDNLRYFAAVHRVERTNLRARMAELLDAAGLTAAADRRVQTYSKGMRQRLHLCIGLLTQPRLLLLDEPTVGLDPQESARLREVIAAFPDSGTTVLLTSHNLLDVERLADRVVMLRQGRVVHDLGLDDFRRLAGHEAVVEISLPHDAVVPAELLELGAAVSRQPEVIGLTLAVDEWSAELLAQVSAALLGQTILKLVVRQTTLDEAFGAAAASTPAA